MKLHYDAFCVLAIGWYVGLGTSVASSQSLTGNLDAHDPSSVVHVDGKYYMFHTGPGVRSKSSTNRIQWSEGGAVFATAPSWIAAAVPDNTGNYWAPDVAYFNGLYHLYYSVSTFGSQDSAIGLATSPTLDPASPNYEWTDRGPVIQSNPGQNPYNTIDPAIIQTSTGDVWMTFGSFWNGIYLTELDPATGLRITPNSPTISLARHLPLNPNAIEAPYIHERDGYFYLFANWDTCCQGTSSTYNIRVGRSTSITGPYLDRNGVSMAGGGGSLFLGTEGNFIGPGHISIFTDQGTDWFGYHYYDGSTGGTARFNLRTVVWDQDGWPLAGPNTAPGDFNFDGQVDLVDYGILSNHLKEAVSPFTSGDVNGDGAVNYFDFHLWKSIYHAASGGGGGRLFSVPEPSPLILVVGGWIGLCRVRRSGRGRHGARRQLEFAAETNCAAPGSTSG